MKPPSSGNLSPGRACLFIAITILLFPGMAAAECSDEEMIAVFIVSGVYPGTDLQVERLHLHQVGEATYPDEQQLLDAINAIQPGYYYLQIELVGPFFHYFYEPGDFGGVAIIDSRDGVVAFAGTVIWMGFGTPSWPIQSTHSWTVLAGDLAAPPNSLEVMNSVYWPDDPGGGWPYGSEADIANATLDHLRQLDVLHSFAQCGDYSATSYVYTPTVGLLDPLQAQCVMIVRGSCGPPWDGTPVSIESQSWGWAKSLFR